MRQIQLFHLSDSERRGIIAILGRYQGQLESAIESGIVPGETQPRREYRSAVARDRREWQKAEAFVKRLSAKAVR